MMEISSIDTCMVMVVMVIMVFMIPEYSKYTRDVLKTGRLN